MQHTIFEDKNNRKPIATAFATDKGVQSQERVLNASNTLINIEEVAQNLFVHLNYPFLYSEWLQK